MRPTGPPTTCNEFCTAFREHHIPKGLMDRKREEFCNLTQGRRTIDEYSREFNRLSRYALEEVSTDSKKQERFRRGLNTGLHRELNLHDYASFQVLVKRPSRQRTCTPPQSSASIPATTAHPVLALRSAGSGSPTVCSGRTTHRG